MAKRTGSRRQKGGGGFSGTDPVNDKSDLIAGIDSQKNLEVYLNTRPLDEARIVALRSALRIFPAVSAVFDVPGNMLSEIRKQALALQSFRALLISLVVGVFGSRYSVRDIGNASTAAAAAASAAAATNAGAGAATARFVAHAAAAAATAAVAEALASAVSAPDAANSRVVANAALAAASARSTAAAAAARAANAVIDATATKALWEALRRDLSVLDSGRGLTDAPLWIGMRPPSYIHRAEILLSNGIRQWSRDWGMIAEWYECIRDGMPPWGLSGDQLDQFVVPLARMGKSFWGNGMDGGEPPPNAVTAEIARRLFNVQALTFVSDVELEEDFTKPTTLWDFFISYSKKDEAFAREVDALLQEAGYSTYVQFNDFRTGNHILQEIKRGLSGMGRMITIHSPDYEASEYCQAEWDAAYSMDVTGKHRKLVPLMLRPTELNPIASQVIYTSLVGLDAAQRKQKILEAVSAAPTIRSHRETIRKLAETASPDVKANEAGEVDIAPNATFDISVVGPDMMDLVEIVVGLADTIYSSLPDNSPKIIGESLSRYARHIEDRKAKAIVGLVKTWALSVQCEYESEGGGAWGAGLKNSFDQFFREHQRFLAHFIRDPEREHIFAETEVDEDAASGSSLTKPVANVAEKIEALAEICGTTPALERVVQEYSRQAESLAHDTSKPDEAGSHVASPKRRFILGQLGFWERMLAVVSGMTTVVTTPQGQALLSALREALDKFIQFLK